MFVCLFVYSLLFFFFPFLFSFVCIFGFLFCLSSFVSFSFSFLEFLNGVCGLRWKCCGGIVAYYVECTNVVNK